jgi:hypothetical protein
MRKKPRRQDVPELARRILEKLVMGLNWGHNHVEEANVPKGLPHVPNLAWYHYVKHELARKGLLQAFKEHGKDLYGLNVNRRSEIMNLVGTKVKPTG